MLVFLQPYNIWTTSISVRRWERKIYKREGRGYRERRMSRKVWGKVEREMKLVQETFSVGYVQTSENARRCFFLFAFSVSFRLCFFSKPEGRRGRRRFQSKQWQPSVSKKKAVTLKEFFFLKLPSYLFVEAKYAVFLLRTPPQSFPLNFHRLLFKHT